MQILLADAKLMHQSAERKPISVPLFQTEAMKLAAEMVDPASGRKMEIWTTEPCMQMYGAQNMTSSLPGKDGKRLCPFAAVALETQHYPDSPNRPDFPSTVLRPGETFRSTTEYRFSILP